MAPFLSFYTPTYRRPQGLARCMASVQSQTAFRDIEQIIVPDYVGLGIGGMYLNVPWYAPVLKGEYVHFLCDDDVLAGPLVVRDLRTLINEHKQPDVMVVGALKAGQRWPTCSGEPVEGQIDLGCLVIRGSLWQEAVAAGAYGSRYEGDYDMARWLWDCHARFVYEPSLLFCKGAVSRGAAEGSWA